MLKEERQAYILHQVNLHNKVLSSHLSETMKVSGDTIRRDLQELAQEGKIIKVHGGALSVSFHRGVTAQNVYSAEDKKTIALKAIQLIQDGMYILTSGGTTIMELARLLPDDLQATFITVSLPAALEYSNHPNIEVIIIGDKISKNSKITVGANTVTQMQKVNADICFLGVNALDIHSGLTDNDWEVMQIKKAMIECSKKVIALSISEKLNTAEHLQVCDIKNLDILITELNPASEVLLPYKEKGIEVL
jgi:DeoR/GlpR family transcriptional regulator of sugar metabolism